MNTSKREREMDDSKHFSHPHSLSYLTIHRMPEGETIDCSGCNFAASDSGAAYACLKCQFFLHEQCFHATRSLKHPSHPLHHLTLVPSPTYPSGQFICSSCSEIGSGLSYSCSACDFDLHVHCASVPLPGNSNTTPAEAEVLPHSETLMTGTGTTSSSTEPSGSRAQTQIHHKSHAKHPLVLLSRNPYPGANGEYVCDGCWERGNGSVYYCSTCDYDLHVECAGLKEQVRRADHQHPLTLFYSNPYKAQGMILECDVCHYNVPENAWAYRCSDCDYGTHIKCVRAKERSKEVVELEKLVATQQQLSLLQQQAQMNAFSTQMSQMTALGTINMCSLSSQMSQDIRDSI